MKFMKLDSKPDAFQAEGNCIRKLCMREDGNQQVCIVGLQEYKVSSVETVKELIEKGNASRSTGTTGANEESCHKKKSRWHLSPAENGLVCSPDLIDFINKKMKQNAFKLVLFPPDQEQQHQKTKVGKGPRPFSISDDFVH